MIKKTLISANNSIKKFKVSSLSYELVLLVSLKREINIIIPLLIPISAAFEIV